MAKKKKNDPLDFESILKIAAIDLEALPPPKPRPEIIELGTVVLDKKTLQPYAGGQYSAGAKVYKSEGMARSATKNRKNFIYVKAYAEIPVTPEFSTVAVNLGK